MARGQVGTMPPKIEDGRVRVGALAVQPKPYIIYYIYIILYIYIICYIYIYYVIYIICYIYIYIYII